MEVLMRSETSKSGTDKGNGEKIRVEMEVCQLLVIKRWMQVSVSGFPGRRVGQYKKLT